MKEYISRPRYMNALRPFIGKNLIKVLIGQRRVGKSYLMYQIMDFIKNENPNVNIIYIDKEQYAFDFIRTYAELIEYIQEQLEESTPNAIFIDEIQDIDQFEKALRHFSSHENIDIYCTGSNARLLSGEFASYLSGRHIEIKVYSLSYTEFLEFHQFENNNETLKQYIKWGGLPFIQNLVKTDEALSEYLKNIYNTIIYRDIIIRFQVRNADFLENLVRFLSSNIGNIISAHKISEYLKSQRVNISPQTVMNYLEYLSSALLIYNVKRVDLSGKKIFEIHEKFYFEDWGISNAIRGMSNIDISKTIENIVFLHLKILGYSPFIGKMGDREIDFVAEKDGNRVYIQVCYLISDETVKTREFGNLLNIQDQFPKYVVSLDEYAPDQVEGVRHLHLREFLTKEIL
jgi:uncharacterized protein